MHQTEQLLFKKLPDQIKPGKSSFNFKTSAIDQWFETLPMANIRVSSKSIYNTLKESNGLKIPYKKRLYLLEKIHEPVTELAANLKKLNLNRELPLGEKHFRIAILQRKLHHQIAIGYLSALRDLINCHVLILCPAKHKTMAMVIERIIRHNSLSLITNYQYYSAPPQGLWSEIHHLFLLAHQEKLLDKKVADTSLQLVKETTIKNAYLQIVLVAVADPYRLAQHHTFSIFRQLEEWSPLADLHKFQDNDDKNCLMIDLSKDTHPTFTTPRDTPNNEFTWSLDTSKLDYSHLIEHLNSPETQTTEIFTVLLKQLSLAWGIAPHRQHNRRHAKSRLKVSIGLSNAHFVLNGYTDPEWLQAETAEKDKNPVLNENTEISAKFSSRSVSSTEKVNDIWGEVFSSNALLGEEDSGKDEVVNKTVQQKMDPHEPQEWNMINESIGGYCLLWQHNDSINAKVGEIIAISHEQEKKEGYWYIGTVRWMKCIGNDKVQIGVQIIAPNAIAVSIAKYTSMQEGIKSRAILLPAIPVLKQPKTLITTALGYETGDQVILNEYRLVNANITSVKTRVVLTNPLETSSHFSRFKYSLAEEFYGTSTKKSSSEHTHQDTLSLDGDTEFDAIWDDL